MEVIDFQLREEVSLQCRERRRDDQKRGEGEVHGRGTAEHATLQRLHIEFAKGFTESNDEDIKRANRGLEDMTTIGYFDVFKRSDILRSLPGSVLKGLRRSPDTNSENIARGPSESGGAAGQG